jgi:hypothetical protein
LLRDSTRWGGSGFRGLRDCEGGDESGDGAGVDGSGGEGDAGGEVGGEVGGDENGGGVEEDDVAAGAAFAGEDGGEDLGVGAGVAALEGFDGGAAEADVFGGEGAEGDCSREAGAAADLGEVAGAGDGEFVHTGLRAGVTACVAGFSVDDEGVAGVEEDHGFGGERDEMRGVDAHDLCGSSGGVGERADEMEDGANAKGAADGHDGLHCRMQAGGVEEGETVLAEGGCAVGGGEVDGEAEGFEDVGGAARGGDGAVAVLGDHQFSPGGSSGGGGDEGGGGGDVEGAAGVGAGAAGVDEEGALGEGEGDGGGGGAHGVDEAGDFRGGGAAGGERAEEGGELEFGGFAAEDGLEELGGVGAGEGLASFDDSFEVGLEGHWFKRSRWRMDELLVRRAGGFGATD